MANLVLSYSALSDYEKCPRKFHEVRILKKYKSDKTEAIIYGEEVHKAAEEYIGNDAPLPNSFSYMRELLDALKRKPGDKYTEHKMAVTEKRTPCDWFAPDAWMRGIADLLIVNKTKALVVDYKTGNDKYADIEQLRLMALLTFAHFPEVVKVKGALLFVLKNRLHSFSLERKDEHTDKGWLCDAITGRSIRISSALSHGQWQPKSSGLCGYCPVVTCEYHNP